MKKDANEYLYNEAVKYLGKYPATRKKIKEYLQKKIKNKKTYARAIFPEGINKEEMIDYIVGRLDELKIINEDHFIESLFNYYQQSLFSIRKIKNKEWIHNYFAKASAYAIMFEERTGMAVPNTVIVMDVDDNEPLVFKEHRDNYTELLLNTKKEYDRRKLFF